MLKIKDNVDLKELEKFKFIGITHQNGFTYINTYCYCNDLHKTTIFIDVNLRIIEITTDFDSEDLDVIYDLIKADLVEKEVEDERNESWEPS